MEELAGERLAQLSELIRVRLAAVISHTCGLREYEAALVSGGRGRVVTGGESVAMKPDVRENFLSLCSLKHMPVR